MAEIDSAKVIAGHTCTVQPVNNNCSLLDPSKPGIIQVLLLMLGPLEREEIGLDHLRSRSVLEDLRQRREELTIAVLSKQMDGRRREIAPTARALTEQSRRDARERGLCQAHEANLAWRTRHYSL